MKLSKKVFEPLDQEEAELMESIEHDEWKISPDSEERINQAVEAAKNTLNKDKRINLRLTQKDYHRIRVKAVQEGMPYQTLISSIVHKYLDGTLTSQ